VGFLDSIGTLLGGFSDVKQIDSDGFDFREKRRQEELQRQQQQQQWAQENTTFGQKQEERGLKMGEDVLAAGGGEQDVEPFLQMMSPEQRVPALKLLRGRAGERKSALAREKALSDAYLRSIGERGQDRRLDWRLDSTESEGAAGRKSREQIAADSQQAAMERVVEMLAGSKDGGGGARKPYWNVKEKRTDFLTNEELGQFPQGTYTDVTTGRSQSNSGNEGMGVIIQNLDDSLANYEESQKGLGMLTPSSMNVAWDRYRSALQSAGQIFGRQFLKDTRVSEQDRQAYAATIGQPSRWLTLLDPKEARRRFSLIKNMAAKYPGVGEAEGGDSGGGIGGKKQYRLKPGANPDLKSSYEEVP